MLRTDGLGEISGRCGKYPSSVECLLRGVVTVVANYGVSDICL